MQNKIYKLINYFLIFISVSLAIGYDNISFCKEHSKINKTTIFICNDPVPASKWHRNVEIALKRLSYGCYKSDNQEYEVVNLWNKSCVDLSSGACTGGDGSVYCKNDVLSRILLAEAWMAAGYAVPILMNPKNKRRTINIDVATAFRIANAQLSGDTIEFDKISDSIIKSLNGNLSVFNRIKQAVDNIQTFDVQYDKRPVPSVDPDTLISYSIYEASVNFIIAFIIGHELSHAHGFCWLNKPSVIEQIGLFKKIINIQSEGDIFCQNPILIDEIKADKCALRVLEYMINAYNKCRTSQFNNRIDEYVTLGFASISKRFAIDGMSLLLFTGLAHETHKSFHSLEYITGDGKESTIILKSSNDGYIYSPLRLILFSELLKYYEFINKYMVSICDDTADRFVLDINSIIFPCKKLKSKKYLYTDESGHHYADSQYDERDKYYSNFEQDYENKIFSKSNSEIDIIEDGKKITILDDVKNTKVRNIDHSFFRRLPELLADYVPIGVVQYWNSEQKEDSHWDKDKICRCSPNDNDINIVNGIREYTNLNYKKAFSYLYNSAEYGNPEAQFIIARMFAFGEGINKNEDDAIRWFEKSATQGHSWAQYYLGKLYLEKGFRQKGIEWLRKSFVNGITKAKYVIEEQDIDFMYYLGLSYLTGDKVKQDYLEASKFFHKAAIKGHSKAQFNLGMMYSKGDGVIQDNKKAVRWFQIASDSGNLDAKFSLYHHYFNGIAVPTNFEKALNFLNEAAEGGLARAQFMLATFYSLGVFVEQDQSKANMWFNKAKENNIEEDLKRMKSNF